MSNEDPDYDEGFDDDEDFEDEIAGEGNRIVGGRAKAVVDYIARYLAEEPDAVEVDLEERRGEVVLLVHASPSDMGRLIGRRGRHVTPRCRRWPSRRRHFLPRARVGGAPG